MKNFAASHMYFILFIMITIVTQTSQAFICTALESDDQKGPSLSWAMRSVPYVLDKQGTTDIAGDSELDTLRDSFAVWNQVSCSDFEFYEDSDADWDNRIGYDYLDPDSNQNALYFYDTDWPHDSDTIALTTVTFNNCSGELLDADIEFNSQQFAYTNTDVQVRTDLMNTAVHEIGHMIGFDHALSSHSVMFPYAQTGQTSGRTLNYDDEDGLCYKYPAGAKNGYCAQISPCSTKCYPPLDCAATVEMDIKSTGCQQGSAFWMIILLFIIALLYLFPPKKQTFY